MIDHLALLSRRHTIRAMMATIVGASMSGCANLIPQSIGLALTPSPLTDPAVFNFALNLEYLEAEYYSRGLTGEGLSADLLGPKPGNVTGGRKVNFNSRYIAEFVAEIANDERNHVRFLRRTIRKSPLIEMSRPEIDLEGSFRAAGAAAGLGDNFDPFADEESFLLGAFIFEDVGVTAYAGAAKLVPTGLRWKQQPASSQWKPITVVSSGARSARWARRRSTRQMPSRRRATRSMVRPRPRRQSAAVTRSLSRPATRTGSPSTGRHSRC